MERRLTKPRLAVLCDYPEEGWPSMDLVAEMLLAELREGDAAGGWGEAVRVCPPFRSRLARVPALGRRGAARNVDRLVNRLWDYPRYARRRVAGHFDLYHVADHSYAQLVHALPAERTGVFCHDLDTFGCLIEPARDARPRWFRTMARHILSGMQKASVVFYSTDPVREQIVRQGLLDAGRLVHAPYGTSREFTHLAADPEPTATVLGEALGGQPFVLHVGSCIPRKRIDVLLDVFAAVRAERPGLHLVQVGGAWTPAQREQIRTLGLGAAATQVRGLTRGQIASLYRTASAVLQPSEAEGFGLPVIEALACGAAVVASDIPVLREVGGGAVAYCPVGDVDAWAAIVIRALNQPASKPALDVRLAQAGRYSWRRHAETVRNAYRAVLANGTPIRTARALI